jgi:flagellar biosynthesis protein FliQ
MATLGVAITANIILVSGPMFILLTINLLNEAYSDSEQFLFAVVPKIIVGVMVLFMGGVWYISYLMGRRSLRKLLG